MNSTPCGNDPELWFSDDATQRSLAATICNTSCPLAERAACLARANRAEEKWGVWGGHDFTSQTLEERRAGDRERASKHRARVAEVAFSCTGQMSLLPLPA